MWKWDSKGIIMEFNKNRMVSKSPSSGVIPLYFFHFSLSQASKGPFLAAKTCSWKT